MTRPFDPPVALASLSGAADAAWARQAAQFAGLALLGGLAVDDPTRTAARAMVDRDREEFLPDDPLAFCVRQFAALDDAPIRPGMNVRAASSDAVAAAAAVCADHDAVVEVNAHCRQAEMCEAGCGETLLEESDRLTAYVEAAAATGATVSVKLRAEVPGVDLPAVAARADTAGADLLHVDAMDTESVIEDVSTRTDAAVIANNGVRDAATVREYLEYGADAVSVGRPSDDHDVMGRVLSAVRSASA